MPLRRSLKALVVAALLASASVLAADAPKPSGAPVPLLWKVSDKDNAVYLLGSFHLLRPSDYPLSGDVEAAFEDAEEVVFELSPKELGSPELAVAMMRAALRQDGKTLQSALPPDIAAQLDGWAQANQGALPKFGMSPQALSMLEPWFAALMVTMVEMGKQGLDPALGLDNHFVRKSAQAGKPSDGLETGQEQIDVLDGSSEKEQIQMLAEALEQADKGSVETTRLHDAWRRGDVDLLWTGMAADMKRDYPELYRRINVARNDAWVPKIRQRLAAPGSDDTLVVVGALHLLGEDGVVEKLRAHGYSVERICSACAR
jgi:uncharacterized protein YbaP (TraB family)